MAVPSFSLLFCLNKAANHILPEDLSGLQVPQQGADALLAPGTTRAHHWDTHHPGRQGLLNSTGHPGSGTQKVGYLVDDGDNPDKDVPQQPTGIQCEARCGAPIPRRWSTGRHGGGVARLAEREEERVNVLPREERDELRERTNGVRWVVSVGL